MKLTLMTVGGILDFIERNHVGRDALVMIKTPGAVIPAAVIHDGVAQSRSDGESETVLVFGLDPITERILFAPELFGAPDTTKQ